MNQPYDFSQAAAEADRCLLCHDAPCSKGCPAHTDPGTFIRKFRMQNIKGAIRTIKENNILGGACGILCPTARLCEKECAATHLDRPIEIGRIQEFLVRHGRQIGFRVFDTPEPALEKVAVIGSGPAGLSCAAELARKGYRVTVFEKMKEPGGVLRYGVPSWRFDKDLLKAELKDIIDLGVQFECGHPVADEGEATGLLKKGFAAVFIAIGLWDAARIFEKTPPGVYTSVDFLAAPHTGGEQPLESQFKGKKVAVIGGGSVAMDCAGSACLMGASDVFLIYRRSFAQMPAEKDERIEALDKNIHFLILNQPKEYITGPDGTVTGIRLVRTELAKADGAKRRSPVEITGSEWTLDVDVVVEAIGNKAFDTSDTLYPGVLVDSKKQIRASVEDCATSLEGVFAGGDIIRGPSLVVNAVQDGKTAANSINHYLKQRRG